MGYRRRGLPGTRPKPVEQWACVREAQAALGKAVAQAAAAAGGTTADPMAGRAGKDVIREQFRVAVPRA